MLTVIYWMEHRAPKEGARESTQEAKGVCSHSHIRINFKIVYAINLFDNIPKRLFHLAFGTMPDRNM